MTTVPALDRPVTDFLAPAAFTLRDNLTIDEALAALRSAPRPATPGGAGQGTSGPSPVAYFYILNDAGELVGVLPTRRLILAPGSARIADLMTRELIVLSERETLFDALELFAMHRLLALPVVDARRRFLGIVELSLYTDEVFDLAQQRQLNEVFQLVGLHLERHKRGGVLAGFRMRMPWLLANITGGLVCAALGSLFSATVEKTVLIALFIPLVLALAESVAVQSMTLAIEEAAVGGRAGGQARKEALTALLLGAGAATIVGFVSLFWPGPRFTTLTIAGSVGGSMFLAAMLGRAVPKMIHLLKLDPRIASGPVTLATVDAVTITLYLLAATMVLGG